MDPVAGVPNFFEKDKALTYVRSLTPVLSA